MTGADLWAAWRVWMAVATVVVLIAAGLLVAIWITARSIRAHAARALRAAETIRKNTLPIWELQTTNETAGRILAVVQAIEAKGGALAQAVGRVDAARAGKETRP